MQAAQTHWQMPPVASTRRVWRSWMAWLLLVVLASLAAASVAAQTPAPHRPSQGQAANQFLRAVLRGEYSAAYGRLAPEVRQTVSLGQFTAAARPLWKSGQRRHSEIKLYKLGLRLGERGASRLFYAFSFAADSSRPTALLEVTFRDTATRSVLGFGLRPLAQRPAAPKSPNALATKP